MKRTYLKNLRYVFLFFVLFYCSIIKSQEAFRFSHYFVEDGLSQSTVFSMTQDNKGCMWIATYNGLNRFDGYEFTTYHHDPEDENSISGDIIWVVKADSRGRIWAGSQKGLSLYDEDKDGFHNYYSGLDNSMSVTQIAEFSDTTMFVCVNNKLQVFDIECKSFSTQELNHDLTQLEISSLMKVGNKLFLGGYDCNLYIYSIKDRGLDKISLYSGGKQIRSMLLQGQNKLWLGTEGDGLYLIDLGSNEVKQFKHTGLNGGLSSNYIRALELDLQGNLWIGTYNDLNIYNSKIGKFLVYSCDETNNTSLSHHSIRCIFRDSQGGMWLGTYWGGVNYYHALKNRFGHIKHIPFKNSLNDNVVNCIVEDDNENLWIGTNGGGVNFFNRSTGKISAYRFSEVKVGNNIKESENVEYIHLDDGNVYIGLHAGGMKIIDITSGRIKHLPVDQNAPEAQKVYSILRRDEKSLWVGTLGGLYIYSKQYGKFKKVKYDKNGDYLEIQQVKVLLKDKFGHLWIGGEKSLELYDVVSGELIKKELPSKDLSSISEVKCIYETLDGAIWIATGQGLYHLNESRDFVEKFTVSDGLLSNVIYGIEEDGYNFLWLSSSNGLMYYDRYKKKFKIYNVNDGLPFDEYNSGSCCKTKDGTMYFGGVKGITVFKPQELLDNPHAPNVYITDFLLYNKRVMPGDETGILKENISETKSIILSPSQRAFTIRYVVSNYVSGKHNTFAYKLEGNDKDWNYTTERSVSYSNLSPGNYRFVVKAANGDGLWCKGLTVLSIKVLPKWYNTWWARLMFVLSVVAVVSLVMKYFLEKKSMKTRLIIEQQEKQHQEEINQMKTRFFINISHELRTPLTLIISPVQEVLARSTDKWVRQQLMYIERNANRLLHIINQLMDYRRAELEVFKLNVTMADAYQIVKDSFSYYEKLADTKGLKYHLDSDIQGRNALVDTKYLDLILNNLLSNAFKYTEEGYISVSLSLDNEYLVIQVEDSGTGIPEEKQKNIFDRFYQLDSDHLGSGIGLSLVQKLVELHHGRIELWSEPGRGSRFSVFIPQDKSVYSAEEINHDNEDVSSGFFTNTSEMFVIDNEKSETEVMLSDGDKKGTVLVVEDNAEVRNYLSQGLSDLFNVITAENGKQALEVVKNNEVDIIVSDVMMPVMDGIKLCKSIKQNVCTSHIPVVMLSAKTDLTAQGEAMVFGADDYIPKPFSLGLLIAKLRNMIFTRRRIIDKYMQATEIEPEKITFNALDEEFIKKAKKVVEDNMDNGEFSTQDFADLMNMSRSNLHQKLKAITGESAIDFIRKIRFAEACRLLKEGQYTIAEISTMVGFNTPSYFATSFKKYMGCLPTEYVKKQ